MTTKSNGLGTIHHHRRPSVSTPGRPRFSSDLTVLERDTEKGERIPREGTGGPGGAGELARGNSEGAAPQSAGRGGCTAPAQPGDPTAAPPAQPGDPTPPSAILARAPDLSPRGPGTQRAASIPARPVASASRSLDDAAGLGRLQKVGPRPWQPHPALSPTPIGPVPAAPLSLANGDSRNAGGFPGGGRHREAKAHAPERGVVLPAES